MNGAPPRNEYPFWSWTDLALFAGLALPCLVAGAALAQVLGLLSLPLKALRVWTSMLFFYAFWFSCLYVLLKSRYRRPFWQSLGWHVPPRGLMASAAAGPLLAFAVGALGMLLHTPQKEMPLLKLIQGPAGIVFFGLFSVLLGPVTEELAFRGFLMPLAIRSLGVAPGIVVAALPFAVLHGPEYAWTWQYVLLIGFAGALFGLVRHHTGSTLASAAMHATYNLTFFVAYVSSGKAY
jgi:membrane protease YdiL (CAAX protease family)